MENEIEVIKEDEMKTSEKRMKNLISAIILLTGLFIGSLFVDVIQLVKGSGFSEKALSQSNIFESSGKTWVAYTEPKVDVQVISDDSCEKCNPSEVLVWLRRVVPTINSQKVDANSDAGKKLIGDSGVKTLPAFIFSDAITKTDFYTQAQVIFDQKDKQYVLKTQEIGLEPGRYLAMPEVKDGDTTFGEKDSNVKVVIYSDFQCPFCKVFWTSFKDALKQYGDRVLFDYKHLPLDIHPQAQNAAMAAECAQDQNKFLEYGDKLYASQADWGAAKNTQKFKNYARMLGLNATQFNGCMDSNKYKDKIAAEVAEATGFGISGTPATFINDDFKTGVISLDDLKKAIDAQLGKQ